MMHASGWCNTSRRSAVAIGAPHWQKAQDEVKATIGPANLIGLHELLDKYVPFSGPRLEPKES